MLNVYVKRSPALQPDQKEVGFSQSNGLRAHVHLPALAVHIHADILSEDRKGSRFVCFGPLICHDDMLQRKWRAMNRDVMKTQHLLSSPQSASHSCCFLSQGWTWRFFPWSNRGYTPSRFL